MAAYAGVGAVLPSATVDGEPKPSRIHEYSWVRGFNYQPSWGSHGLHIWNDFREATFAKEVDLGLEHFPKLNVLRIWFSYDAHVADPDKFRAAAKRAAQMLAERKIKMIPVLFNGWRSIVEFGGFSIEQLYWSLLNNPRFGPHRQYLCELIEALRPGDNILMYDVSNEPFNNRGSRGLPQSHGGADSRPGFQDADFDRHAGMSGNRGSGRSRPDRLVPGHEIYNEFC